MVVFKTYLNKNITNPFKKKIKILLVLVVTTRAVKMG